MTSGDLRFRIIPMTDNSSYELVSQSLSIISHGLHDNEDDRIFEFEYIMKYFVQKSIKRVSVPCIS